jgi:hypothetical protein
MKKLHIIRHMALLIVMSSAFIGARSQVLISSGTGTPDNSSMLEIQSDSKGLLIPRMTTAQRGLISAPAEGLLVYDTDRHSFFLRGSGKWIDLSTSSEIWSQNTTGAYLTSQSINVAVGTTPVVGKKMVIRADAGKAITDPLFEVQDAAGFPILRVTSEGVRVYVKPHTIGKASSGGFAVGRYGIAKEGEKGLNDLFFVNTSGTRVYTTGAVEDGGGFAVAQYNSSNQENYSFYTTENSTRVFTDGKLTAEKDSNEIQTNGVIYEHEGDSYPKATSGGFAVGRYGIAKGNNDNYMFMIPENYFIGHDAGEGIQLNPVSFTGKYNTFFGYQSGMVNNDGFQNVFIGYQTGLANVSGDDNIFVGNQSGYGNTTGWRNVFLGSTAGYTNTSGNDNVFLGTNAGYANLTGISNVFIGSYAGYKNIGGTGADDDGDYNIFIGDRSGFANTLGYGNVFMGYQSGNSNVDGDDNVFLGYQSGYWNTAGVRNIFLGAHSGYRNIDGFANIFIGVGAGYYNETGDNNTCLGYVTGYNLSSGVNNVFIGSSTGYNNTSGSYNLFLGFEAGLWNSLGSWNTFLGYQSGYANTTGNYNLFIGYFSGKSNTTGTDNLFIGTESGSKNTTTSNNTFIGHYTGYSNTGGMNNMFIGPNAGYSNINGVNNHFIGHRAGYSNTSGGNNLFIGDEAGGDNTEGSYNMFIGSASGTANKTGSHNLALGYLAGHAMDAANNNILIGSFAGYGLTTGLNNLIIGYSAGGVTTGDQNTMLGFQSGYNCLEGNGNIFIGNESGFNETGSNKLYIQNSQYDAPLIYGDFITDLVNINASLTFNSSVNSITLPSGRGSAGSVLTTGGDGTTSWSSTLSVYDNDWTVSGNNMYSQVSGNVGIGNSSPGSKLVVENNNTSGNTVYVNASSTTGITTALNGNQNSTEGFGGYFFANNTVGSATGVYGRTNTPDGYGVAGHSFYAGVGVGAWSYSGNLIEAYAGDYPGGILRFYIDQNGNLFSDGVYNSFKKTKSDKGITEYISTFSIQSPEAILEDFGTMALTDGIADVTFDQTFAQLADLTKSYQVFLTAVCDEVVLLTVSKKEKTGFTVKGVYLDGKPANCSFDYRIVVKDAEHKNTRFQKIDIPTETIVPRGGN